MFFQILIGLVSVSVVTAAGETLDFPTNQHSSSVTCMDNLKGLCKKLGTDQEFCINPSTNYKCRKTCGLCAHGNSSIPCEDTSSDKICAEVKKQKGFCANPTTSVRCRKTCGVCNATCEDTMTDPTLCPKLVKDPTFCSQDEMKLNCKKSCGFCGNVTLNMDQDATTGVGNTSSGQDNSTFKLSNYADLNPDPTSHRNAFRGGIAFGKPATQSSTSPGHPADLANSGSDTCSRTLSNDSSPWWQVDLQAVYTITSVVILNSKDCCCDSLVSVSIDVFENNATNNDAIEENSRNCDYDDKPYRCGEERTLQCASNTWGRFLRISKPMPEMSFCGIAVYGTKVVGTACPVLENVNYPDEEHKPFFSTNNQSVGTPVSVKGCRPGQSLIGKKKLTCLQNHHWDYPIPICINDIKRNIAFKMPTFQSSKNTTGSKAVDGETDGTFFTEACSATLATDTNPWWRVDLQHSYTVHNITIVNREDCCCDSLSNFTVLVLSSLHPKQWSVCDSGVPEFGCGEVRTIHCPVNTTECPALVNDAQTEPNDATFPILSTRRRSVGTVVHIDKCPGNLSPLGENKLTCMPNGKWDRPLALCIDKEKNIALYKAVRMSSMLNPNTSGAAAVDGLYRGANGEVMCARTADTDNQPWLEVDLAGLYGVEAVYITIKGGTCDFLRDVTILVTDDTSSVNTTCAAHVNIMQCGLPKKITCDHGVVGRKVTIQTAISELTLCEVVVIGKRQKAGCPPLSGNFILSTKQHVEGTEVTISGCMRGMSVAGVKTLKCLATGHWNVTVPVCMDMRGNLVKGKTAMMSSVSPRQNCSAKVAVDGIFDQGVPGMFCAMTHIRDTAPWWQVDLGDIYTVLSVAITNRHDCCCDALREINIYVYGDELSPRSPKHRGVKCAEGASPFACGETKILACETDTVGRYVRILKHQPNLTLCEVVIKGQKHKRTDCPPLQDSALPATVFSKDNLNKLRMSTSKRTPGTEVRLSCFNNYRIVGSNSLKCLPGGKWNHIPPQCVDTNTKLDMWCPIKEGYFYETTSNFCFKLEPVLGSWYEAVNACSAVVDSVLAELNTDVKHTVVFEAIQSHEKYRSTNYYIGGSKFPHPDEWMWMNHTKVDRHHFAIHTSSPGERCLMISSSYGKFKGQACSMKEGRICERRQHPRGPPLCDDSWVPETCDLKAIKGFCDSADPRRYKTMKKHCRRTCGYCSVTDEMCKDTYRYRTCETKKKQNACNNPSQRQKCMKTCGRCPKITLQPEQTATLPDTTSHNTDCIDLIDDAEVKCQRQKTESGCTSKRMSQYCKKTCKMCSKEPCLDIAEKRSLLCPTMTKHGSKCPVSYSRKCSKSCGCTYYTKCGVHTSDLSGQASSPLFPEHYPGNAYCVYSIKYRVQTDSSPQRMNIVLEVLGIQNGDSLKISRAVIQKLFPVPDGHKKDIFSYTLSGEFVAEFTSGINGSGEGFKLSWGLAEESGIPQDIRNSLTWACNSKEMKVIVSGNGFRRNYSNVSRAGLLSFSDTKCRRWQSSLTTRLDACGTTRKETATKVTFRGQLLWNHPTRNGTAVSLPVHCSFPKSPLISKSISALPGLEYVSVLMDLYMGTARVGTYPFSITSAAPLTIMLTTTTPSVVSQIEPVSCHVIAEDSKRGKIDITRLISQTCPVRANVTRGPEEIRIDTSSMALLFATLPADSKVYLICKVRLCEPQPCENKCPAKTHDNSTVVRLKLGPVIITERLNATVPTTNQTMSTSGETTEDTTMSLSMVSNAVSSTDLKLGEDGITEGRDHELNATRDGGVGPIQDVQPDETDYTGSDVQTEDDAADPTKGDNPGKTEPHEGAAEPNQNQPVSTDSSTDGPPGNLALPPDSETDAADNSVTTGTAVGVSVGVVMVAGMGITLAAIKYGPTIKVFKRGQPRTIP